MSSNNEDVLKVFLLDSHALEKCLAKGSDNDHALISGQVTSEIFVTADIREDFLGAFPDDKEMLNSVCATARLKSEDKKLAAVFSDRLQNQVNTDDPEIQDKIFLVAISRRLKATLVSGEGDQSDDSLTSLATRLEAPCISSAIFLSGLGE